MLFVSANHRRQKVGWRNEEGATAVEFALVIPMFLTLLIGGFQVAWIMHCAGTVRYELESTARSLMLDPTITQTQLQTAVNAKLTGMVDTSKVKVTLVTDNSTAGAPVFRASSVYQPTLSVPFISNWPLTLRATTTVPVP